MKLQLRNKHGEEVGSVQVREDIFGVPPNPTLVHQVMVAQLANARQGTVSTKTRGQVSGGGRKPRLQKHTGQARAGTVNAAQWRGGGAVFGPHPRSFRHHTPKRMRRLSLVTTLSDKVREGEVVVVDELTLEQPKTRELAQVLDALEAGPSALLVADGADPTVLRCAQNIPNLKLLPSSLLNTVDLLNHRKVIITLDAVRRCEEIWGGIRKRRRQRAAAAAPPI